MALGISKPFGAALGAFGAILASFALASCAAADEPAPPPPVRWNAAALQSLGHWAKAAPEDGLPMPDSAALDAAIAGADGAAIDRAADALALTLARMHLLGAASLAERAGWRIADSDAAVDLPARLAGALAGGGLDAFYTGLRPLHPDYAAIRGGLAIETDPARRRTLARNLERWRWMPQSLGDSFVLVNTAAYEARLWRHGKLEGTWKVVVGKPSTPSPVFSAQITGVTLNPWWNIPASIVRENHGVFLESKGYVYANGGWHQRPGPGNALGQMKLVMPNPYSVYLHDTPSKSLFAREARAFSHGCIRVGDALGFAATLLQGAKTRAQVDAIVASRETVTVALPEHLPVYITYFTATATPDGTVSLRPDVYGRDGSIARIARGEAPASFCPTGPSASGDAPSG